MNNRADWVIFIAILRISPYSNYDPIRSLKTVLKTVLKTIDKNVYFTNINIQYSRMHHINKRNNYIGINC